MLPKASVPVPDLTIQLPPDASVLHNNSKVVVAGIAPSAHVISNDATPLVIVVDDEVPPAAGAPTKSKSIGEFTPSPETVILSSPEFTIVNLIADAVSASILKCVTSVSQYVVVSPPPPVSVDPSL
jgi:hypothetical protein